VPCAIEGSIRTVEKTKVAEFPVLGSSVERIRRWGGISGLVLRRWNNAARIA